MSIEKMITGFQAWVAGWMVFLFQRWRNMGGGTDFEGKMMCSLWTH